MKWPRCRLGQLCPLGQLSSCPTVQLQVDVATYKVCTVMRVLISHATLVTTYESGRESEGDTDGLRERERERESFVIVSRDANLI